MATLPVSVLVASSVSIGGLVGIVSCSGIARRGGISSVGIGSVPGIRVRIRVVVPSRSISISGVCIVAVLVSLALALVSCCSITSSSCSSSSGSSSGGGCRIEGCGY